MSSNTQTSSELRYLKLAETHEIAPNTGKSVSANGQQIALFNLNGTFYAISSSCPHRGAPLSEGILQGEKVFCAWHCFDFDLKTGACGAVPELSVRTYEVKVEDTAILVRC
jgi:NAD(P)H-dependent nitrite reductase small subunit